MPHVENTKYLQLESRNQSHSCHSAGHIFFYWNIVALPALSDSTVQQSDPYTYISSFMESLPI